MFNTEQIVIGKIFGHFGLQGWLKVHSYTRPLEEIFEFSHWNVMIKDIVKEKTQYPLIAFRIEQYKVHRKHQTVKLSGVNSREQGKKLIGQNVSVNGCQLQILPNGEYYWRQLIGLQVWNVEQQHLGTVDYLLETGANDVLVVTYKELDKFKHSKMVKEHLVPWIPDVIKEVDFNQFFIKVDWDSEF